VVGSCPVYRSFVCHCVSAIKLIAPEVALPYREPSFTAICGSSHLTRAYKCYRPCMFFSCVSRMSFSHFLIGCLSPPSSLRPSPASCPLSRTSPVLFRRIVALVFSSLSLLIPRALVWYGFGWYGICRGLCALVLVLPADWLPTCVAAAVGTRSAIMGAPFGCLHGRSPSRSPSRNKPWQHQRAVRMRRQ